MRSLLITLALAIALGGCGRKEGGKDGWTLPPRDPPMLYDAMEDATARLPADKIGSLTRAVEQAHRTRAQMAQCGRGTESKRMCVGNSFGLLASELSLVQGQASGAGQIAGAKRCRSALSALVHRSYEGQERVQGVWDAMYERDAAQATAAERAYDATQAEMLAAHRRVLRHCG